MWCVLVFPRLDDARVSDFVEKPNHDLVLLDSETVEVLSDHFGKLFFALPSKVLFSGHCRRLQADTGS